MQSTPNSRAGAAFCGRFRPSGHELLASTPGSNGPLQRQAHQRPRPKQPLHDFCSSTANGRARFCADLPHGAWASDLGGLSPCTHWWALSRAVAHDDPQAQVPRLVPCIRAFFAGDASGGRSDSGPGGRALARSPPDAPSITAGCRSAIASAPARCFSADALGVQAKLAAEANALMHEWPAPISGQPELRAAAVRVEAARLVILPNRAPRPNTILSKLFMYQRFLTSSIWMRFIGFAGSSAWVSRRHPGGPRSLRSWLIRQARTREWPQVGWRCSWPGG